MTILGSFSSGALESFWSFWDKIQYKITSFAILQMFGPNTIGRGRGQSTSDRKRRARRWNLRSRTNSLAEALAQNQNGIFSTKMMRFLLFRVYGQKCMVFDGLGFTVQKCAFF